MGAGTLAGAVGFLYFGTFGARDVLVQVEIGEEEIRVVDERGELLRSTEYRYVRKTEVQTLYLTIFQRIEGIVACSKILWAGKPNSFWRILTARIALKIRSSTRLAGGKRTNTGATSLCTIPTVLRLSTTRRPGSSCRRA